MHRDVDRRDDVARENAAEGAAQRKPLDGFDALDEAGVPYFVGEFEEKMTSFDHFQIQLETFVENLLFGFGDALSWLAAGAKSVDWFELNSSANGGSSCGKPDYGFFTSSLPTATETPYYGYLLASILAKPNAKLAALSTSSGLDSDSQRARPPNTRAPSATAADAMNVDASSGTPQANA